MSTQTTTTEQKNQKPKKLQLVLTMAGAVSAGAYTIGALDFLFEALQQWHEAYDKDKVGIPEPNVELKVVVGASAGGMCSAMFALRNLQDWQTFKHKNEGSHNGPIAYNPADWDYKSRGINNLGYKAWVESVDIMGLLESNDFEQDKSHTVKSIFDSTLLDQIANETFEAKDAKLYVNKPPFIADELEFALTLSNNLGIPYFSEFEGSQDQGYHMRKHADFLRFLMVNKYDVQDGKLHIDDKGRIILDRSRYEAEKDVETSSWGILKQAALATGAFPFGLAARTIKGRIWKDIIWRNTGISSEKVTVADVDYPFETTATLNRKNPSESKSTPKKVKLDLQAMDNHYNRKPTGLNTLKDNLSVQAIYTDGGMLNNEPFDLGEKLLTDGSETTAIESTEREFWSTTIMIDPFPNMEPFKQDKFITRKEDEADKTPVEKLNENMDILNLPGMLIGSLLKNGLYKEELGYQLEDKRNFGRFMIAPKRTIFTQSNGSWTTTPVTDPERHSACSAVSAFGGFLDKRYRVHDYILGRRNAQQFLKTIFTVSVVVDANGEKIVADGNTLFTDHVKLYDDYLVTNDQTDQDLLRQRGVLDYGSNRHGKLPIIPLYGTAAVEVPPMAWPVYDQTDDRWKEMNEKMYKRFRLMVERLAARLTKKWREKNIGRRIGYALVKPVLISFIADRMTTMAREKFHKDMMMYNGADK